MPDSEAKGASGASEGALGLGERLRSARKARAMSLDQVAEALHLDDSIVLALEEEDFSTLGAPVFVRGHLKSYAQLLGLPVESVLGAYQQIQPPEDITPKIPESRHRSVTINPVTWSFYALVILLVGALVAYVLQGDQESPVPLRNTIDAPVTAAGPLTEEPATAVGSPADESLPAPVGAPDDLSTPAEIPESPGGAAPPAAASAPAATLPAVSEPASAAPSAATPAPDDRLRLSLYFRKESWVEISDANRRLLFGLQREGIRRELTGEPPIQVLLGNSRGVDVYVDDSAYAIPRERINGNVARFVIDRETARQATANE